LSGAGNGMSAGGVSASGVSGAAQLDAGTSFLCDDDWEAHIDFRWDERVVPQVGELGVGYVPATLSYHPCI
jgi:hypothetical protein